jgi:large subunit ribosomal protein L18Ae
VVGRQIPSEANPEPTCYRIRVFAKNTVIAKSKFWYQMKRQNKVRRIQGEVVSVSEIFERKTNSIKNYGILLRYLTRTDNINMYKEYRATTLCQAVSMLYQELAGRHSARSESVHIIKTSIVQDSDVLRSSTVQMTKKNLRFPKITHVKRAPTAAQYSVFKATRPTVI